MSNFESFLWGVAVIVIAAMIIGFGKLIQNKLSDQIRLAAKLTQPGDLQVMQAIGCACMIVTITCKGNRLAKIRGAFIALEGFDATPHFEKGWGESFGHVPVKGAPPPVLTVDLIPLRNPDGIDGYVLEKDDAVKFAMPLLGLPFPDKFTDAPSQSVWIGVRHFDDSETIILRGVSIQNMIGDLISVWGNQIQKLNVPVNIGLQVSSAVPGGNPKLIGKTNPNPISFVDEESPSRETGQPSAHNAGEFKFPVYAIVSKDNSRVILMLPYPDGPKLPVFTSLENANDFKSTVSDEAAVVTFQNPGQLLKILEAPAHTSDGKLPSFDVLLESVGPQGRQFGLIARQHFVTLLKSMLQ